ncbi:trypsin-1-like [Phymastichus coffea]|uniref:trypsin-1-like n=1 Tax=Phymastichus coffea TaxID=108790 RepID=UPI00273C4318|nr:trypsin-1-like [Phymastichus coffea]
MTLYIILMVLCPVMILGDIISWISIVELLKPSLFIPHGRIVGGTPTSIEEHPWQVSIQMLGFHMCGGSIVSQNFILTAGHCASYLSGWLSVRVNSSIKHKDGAVHRVDQIIRHEDYSINELGVSVNDVAVLKLRTCIVLGQGSQPVDLFNSNENAPNGVLATISGWGALTEGGSSPEILHIAHVPIVDKKVCHKAYEFQGGLSHGQICAAYPQGGKDTCQGDSGGPMVVDGRQAGIVSWGNGCARKGYPGVYTEIAYFRKWISKNTGV